MVPSSLLCNLECIYTRMIQVHYCILVYPHTDYIDIHRHLVFENDLINYFVPWSLPLQTPATIKNPDLHVHSASPALFPHTAFTSHPPLSGLHTSKYFELFNCTKNNTV